MEAFITILSTGGTILAGIAIAFSIIAAVAPIIIMVQLSNVNHHLKEIKRQMLNEQIEARNRHQDIMEEFRCIKYKIHDKDNEENTHE